MDLCDDVLKGVSSIPCFSEKTIQGEKGEGARGVNVQDAGSLKVRGNGHRVPAGVKGSINEWRGTKSTRREELGARRIEDGAEIINFFAALRCDFFQRELAVENILGGVVVHVAEVPNVPIDGGAFKFLGIEHGTGFIERPCEVVAVIVEVDVGVLRSIEATALAVGHHRVEPGDDFVSGLTEIFTNECLEAMDIIAQKLGVVVEHFLEVRDDPAFVNAVAMKAAGELIIDAAAGHLFERNRESLLSFCVVAVRSRPQAEDRARRGG